MTYHQIFDEVNNLAHLLQVENNEAIAILSQIANNNKMQHHIANLLNKITELIVKIKHLKTCIHRQTKNRLIAFFLVNVRESL